jgi:hypothetical protein
VEEGKFHCHNKRHGLPKEAMSTVIQIEIKAQQERGVIRD